MAESTLLRVVSAVVTATALSTVQSSVPMARADSDTTARQVVAQPVGNVALDWSPTYMSDDHKYTARQARAVAKRFDLVVAMPTAFRNHAGSMRRANPNVRLLAYSNGTILGRAKAGGYPESAFAHALSGARITLPAWDSYLMDPASPLWKAAASRMCVGRSAKGGYDGCLVDNLTLGIWAKGHVTALPVKPGTRRLYTQAEYQQALIRLAAYLERRAPGLTYIGNAIENSYRFWRADVKSSVAAKRLSGAQMEDFLRGAVSPVTAFPQGQAWLDNVAVIRELDASGVTGLFTTKLWVRATAAQVAAWQRFAMASFLMAANGDSYLAFTPSRNKAGAMGVNNPYAMPGDLGPPTGKMTRHASGAYYRQFENGVSVVNPTPSTVTVRFSSSMRTLAGSNASGVTLPPKGADVVIGRADVIQAGRADTVKPTARVLSAVADGSGVTLAGVASDDRAVSSVALAARNNSTMRWLRQDGSWGTYEEHAAFLDSPRSRSTTWTKRFELPPGEYGFVVSVVDASANQNDSRPWRDVTVPAGSALAAARVPVGSARQTYP